LTPRLPPQLLLLSPMLLLLPQTLPPQAYDTVPLRPREP
jgi:hypothetical protein